jgi:hypothetical protein
VGDVIDDTQLQDLLEEVERREAERQRIVPSELLFNKQLAVFNDESRYKLLRCGRRGGKSYTWGVSCLFEGFRYARSTPIYLTLSRQDSRDILWPVLEELNDKLRLGLFFNKATADVNLPNGSRLLLRGAGSRREIDKVRGRKFPVAIVDEAQMLGQDLDYLLDEVLEPGLADYQGWMGISGTPNASGYGVFYELDNDPHNSTWSKHHWTFLDNPHIPDPSGFLKKVMQRRGWNESHPGYRREYLGEWTVDDSGKAYKINADINVCATFPHELAEDWKYGLGIDIGWNDPTSFVVLASSKTLGQIYIIDAYEEAEMPTPQIIAQIDRFQKEYPLGRIMCDSGGGGKRLIEDLKQVYGMPLEAADKVDLQGQVALINGELGRGAIVFCRDRCFNLINDHFALEWDSTKLAIDKWVFPRSARDHGPDALRYVIRAFWHNSFRPVKVKERKTGRAYWDEQEEKMERYAIKQNEGAERRARDIRSLLIE